MSATADQIRLEASWKAALLDQFTQDYMRRLRQFLVREKAAGSTIYPPAKHWFAALDHTPLDEVRVVIIGQDPYHGPGQAHGLCFSVPPGVQVPPSLQNIFREIAADMADPEVPGHKAGGSFRPGHGDLRPWAGQGVLLLNAVLTVARDHAGSHRNQGWETFTDRIVAVLHERCTGLVFLLWGAHAGRKGAGIDENRHLVLRAPHPSPLSAQRGFFGCRHFSTCNRYLVQHGRAPIDWFRVG